MISRDLRASLLQRADLCVKCGLCLPHCPTYGLEANEADSPRGRISLMQGLASGMLEPSERLQHHLEGCLSCRSCERACPVQVPFGPMMDDAHTLLQPRRGWRHWGLRLAAAALAHRMLRGVIANLLRIYQRLPFSAWLARVPGWSHSRLGRLESLLPRTTVRVPTAAGSTAEAAVQLFAGCTGEWLDSAALRDTLQVLERIGKTAAKPVFTGCCGALQQHAGLRKPAQALARSNLLALDANLPVLSLASGCGAMLRDYETLLPEGRGFAQRVQDLSHYVEQHFPADLLITPLKGKAAVHLACTQRNVLRGDAPMLRLLQRIPALQLEILNPQSSCCGAAGAHMLLQPKAADALLQPLLNRAESLQPDYLVTANIGCALHMRAGLRRRGLKVEVLHPMSLLARGLQSPAAEGPRQSAA